jgi:hypothetical protein
MNSGGAARGTGRGRRGAANARGGATGRAGLAGRGAAPATRASAGAIVCGRIVRRSRVRASGRRPCGRRARRLGDVGRTRRCRVSTLCSRSPGVDSTGCSATGGAIPRPPTAARGSLPRPRTTTIESTLATASATTPLSVGRGARGGIRRPAESDRAGSISALLMRVAANTPPGSCRSRACGAAGDAAKMFGRSPPGVWLVGSHRAHIARHLQSSPRREWPPDVRAR